MKNKSVINLSLVIAAVAFIGIGYYFNNKPAPLVRRLLPIFGEYQINPNKVTDTTWHTIGDFSFKDQQGNIFTNQTIAGKIYVADYFFTTCQSICPIMANQMERVYEKYEKNNNVVIVSHTVNPENDSISILAEYAKSHNAAYGKWYFVTGGKKELYDLARNSYMLTATKGDGGEDDFIHTQNFALIDKYKRIRGYYDGTDSTQINLLIHDISLLLKEEAQ
jgi:protein SCO1/2